MDIVTTSLEALIQRATCNQNQCPDTAAIDAFCGLICKEPNSAQTATRFITAKVHSLQEWEALQALHVLDACMKRCGSNFHSEVGKFRFLNELIKLVSPKYNGAHTPEPVKRRVLELMRSWTMYYPKEFKIKEAYEMLKKQGVVKEETIRPMSEVHKSLEQNIMPPPPPRPKDTIFHDAEKSRVLQKLLQSKNPEDLQAANRLIKTMVREDEQRVEMKYRHLTELEAAQNNARLLSEMLDSFSRESSSRQDLELIKELQSSCLQYQPKIQRLLSEVNNDERLVHEVLAAYDELNDVLQKFLAVVVRGIPPSSLNGSNLLDLSTPSEETPTSPDNLVQLPDHLSSISLDEPLASSSEAAFLSPSLTQTQTPLDQPLLSLLAPIPPKPLSTLASMGDIFSSVAPPGPAPVTLLKSESEVPPAKTGMEELDALSKSLLRQSLPQTTPLSMLPNLGKVPMNQLPLSHQASPARSLPSPPHSPLDLAPAPTPSHTASLDLLLGSTEDLATEPVQLNGDVPCSEPQTSKVSNGMTEEKTDTDVSTKSDSIIVKPLGDITVPLESIKPGSLSPLTVLEERGIAVTIHFGRDCPRPDVSVFVVTTTSKSQFPITDYLFQAIVPKGCRLKLQPPSSTDLPAHNPFLPPAAITQVMLIASPNKEAILLRVVISFTVDDETVTEMNEVDKFPLLNL